MTCLQGEMYFLTTAVAGANLYGCSPDNAWSLKSGGGGSSVQIQNANTPVGSRPILDVSNGLGVLLAVSDTGTDIAIQPSVDTAPDSDARLITIWSDAVVRLFQRFRDHLHMCAFSVAHDLHHGDGLTLDARCQRNRWTDYAECGYLRHPACETGGWSYRSSQRGRCRRPNASKLWNDGTSFRIMATRGPQGIFGEARPGCDGTVRGRLWFVAGTAGIADSLTVCAKDASDAYAWRTIY